MKLGDIAHSRAGDKGNISNLSLIPYNELDYLFLKKQITEEKVKAILMNESKVRLLGMNYLIFTHLILFWKLLCIQGLRDLWH